MTTRAELEKFVIGEFTSTSLEERLEEEIASLDGVRREIALRGMLACRLGLSVESVSRLMDWRAFERFCASVLTAAGFETVENLTFTRPRMQLDVVAIDPSVVLSIDCKHWANSGGASLLSKAAWRQIERSRRLKEKIPVEGRPVISAIVTMTEQPFRFVGGAAVVPVHTLRDFALGALSYTANLEVV